MLLLPLVYAPVLPLIRIGLRHKPVLRDRLFYGVLAGAFAHGAYLMYVVLLSLRLILPLCAPVFSGWSIATLEQFCCKFIFGTAYIL
ncbi:hypothetical protein BAE44_0012442 [Dichanthelium oligosanthes]|uniref:Uncharacterized protein n=1 Tax=Dichanthelium oligosanthes TaxID=888268 RepID=A0A1E5VN31_9POAL|nr:hypothetical protein BAE44_0012442 [Dichanthelium oligosanthes]